MASVVSIFARTLARAAGLELNRCGEVSQGKHVLYRLGHGTADRIPDHAYFEMIEWLRVFCDDDPGLVFEYATTIRNNDLGPLGLAVKSAPTLRDSLSRLEQYFRLITDTAVYRLEEGTGPALFVLDADAPALPAFHLRDECALAGVADNIRAFGNAGIELDHVSFKHECRNDPARFEAFFGCDVRFSSDRSAIAIAPHCLDLPNRLGDPGICDFLTQHLDAEILRLPGQTTLKQQVLHHLSTRLSDGVPQASDVAMQLGLSERTFYRRLADENTTFRDVLRDAQLSLAQELLSDSACSIAEVAFLTGFSEQSTFSRAFKRWVGAAPAQFRQLSL
ncbi:MAG: AraC family transcriptional regulator ligand-binding domain-containing protein [Pseudomonadota bacterium]